jgi:hypothetical protein
MFMVFLSGLAAATVPPRLAAINADNHNSLFWKS